MNLKQWPYIQSKSRYNAKTDEIRLKEGENDTGVNIKKLQQSNFRIKLTDFETLEFYRLTYVPLRLYEITVVVEKALKREHFARI